MNFFDYLKERAEKDRMNKIVFYGASTTSAEFIFPNWGEIIRWALKDSMEESLGIENYKKANWNIETINFGLNGASSTDLLERFENLVLSADPQIIF